MLSTVGIVYGNVYLSLDKMMFNIWDINYPLAFIVKYQRDYYGHSRSDYMKDVLKIKNNRLLTLMQHV